MTTPKEAAFNRFKAFLEGQLDAKQLEMKLLTGEISALNAALSSLRAILEDEEHKRGGAS